MDTDSLITETLISSLALCGPTANKQNPMLQRTELIPPPYSATCSVTVLVNSRPCTMAITYYICLCVCTLKLAIPNVLPAYPAMLTPSLFSPGRPVLSLTSDPPYPAVLFPDPPGPGRSYFNYAYACELVPALTGDPAYPAILIPGLFGLGRALEKVVR